MFLNIDRFSPDKLAIVDCEGAKVTYGELTKYSAEIGKALPRSIVLCLCKNLAGALAGFIAFLSNNVVPILVSEDIDPQLLARLDEVYKPEYYWRPSCSDCNGALYSRWGYSLVRTNHPFQPINEKLSLLLMTSGSTGSPKLVRHKYGNQEANARNVAAVFGWTEAERVLADLPIHYTMGLNVINSHLYVGATVLLTTHNIMSKEYWDFMKGERASNITGVPFSYDLMLKLRFTKMDLPHLRTIASGGGRLTDAQFQELARYARDTDRRFFSTFGTTETSARMAFLDPKLALEKYGSIGKAIPEGELFLLDEEGQVITEMAAEGEMGYRGPNVTMGYALCRDDLLKGDEWQGQYLTGDIARRDAEGYYYIIGRKKRFLKLLSNRVSLDHCERLIRQEFQSDCACTGSDEKMIIYMTDPEAVKQVVTFISEKTKISPLLFEARTIAQIPKNEAGKIRYRELESI